MERTSPPRCTYGMASALAYSLGSAGEFAMCGVGLVASKYIKPCQQCNQSDKQNKQNKQNKSVQHRNW